MKKNDLSINIQSIKKTKFQMITWFSTVFTMMVIFLSTLIIRQTNTILKEKVAALENELNAQAAINLYTNIQSIEATGDYIKNITLPINKAINENEYTDHEKKLILDELDTFLCDFSEIKDYSDLAIIYSDGSYSGILNSPTAKIRDPQKLYEELENFLILNHYKKNWITGDFSDFKSIYFIKSIYNNAIFVCSIDAVRVNQFINRPDSMNIKTRIVNDSNQIIYSTDLKEIGDSVSEQYLKYFENTDLFHIYKKTLFSMTPCENGWKLITSTEMKELMKERKDLITYVIILSVLAIGFILIFCIVFSLKLSIPIEHLIVSLHNQATKDPITKLCNAKTFEEKTTELINTMGGENLAFFYMDIDHFNSIIDIQGRSESENILFDVSDSIRRIFPNNAILGHFGTDRFLVCTIVSPDPDNENSVSSFCEKLQQELFTRFQGDFDITMSIGVSLYPSHGKSFKILYDMAERAMTSVKRTSRNDWHIFDPSKDLKTWK